MTLPNNAANQALRARASRSLFLELLKDKVVTTPGSGTYAWNVISPSLEIGKDFEDMVAHVLVEGMEAEAEWAIRFTCSYDGYAFTAPANDASQLIAIGTNPNGYFVSMVFSDRDVVGRFIQFELGLRDDTTPRTGRISGGVAIRFASQ